MSCTRYIVELVLKDLISISGIDWVSTAVAASGRLSVASLSLGGGAIASVDAAVASVGYTAIK